MKKGIKYEIVFINYFMANIINIFKKIKIKNLKINYIIHVVVYEKVIVII